MNEKEIKKIMESCGLPDSCKNIELKETHISWVILTDNYAFKIKKPVSFSFLDFSGLEERKYYCEEELALNRRLEPEIYLEVIPVTKGMLTKEGDNEEIVDYTVKMKRLDNSKEMISMLDRDEVHREHIEALAEKIADFHRKARIIKNAFDTTGFQEKFADIESQLPVIKERFGKEKKDMVTDCLKKSHSYLNRNRSFFNDRIIFGHRKDIHGDLNATNIFLYDEPVIFDCIEFDKEYRQIDIMNEVAFLCVDLDFYEKQDLREYFTNKYYEFYGIKENTKQREMFNYYKAYRANVRAKISLIDALEKKKNNEKEIKNAKRYLDLMNEYFNEIKNI